MTTMARAQPAEFRHDIVAVARKRQAPLEQVTRDFGIGEAAGTGQPLGGRLRQLPAAGFDQPGLKPA